MTQSWVGREKGDYERSKYDQNTLSKKEKYILETKKIVQ